MSFPRRYATLIDGGFLLRKLENKLKKFPTADQVEAVASSIAQHSCVQGLHRLRVYFYHARPATGILTNPLNKAQTDLSSTPIFRAHESLLDTLELRPDFALRLGETSTQDWKLGSNALKSLLRKPRQIEAGDLVPNITQKGVDLRIGLDIARLALTQSVQAIVAVTGDSDLIPAFKFARREGLRVFLCHFDHGGTQMKFTIAIEVGTKKTAFGVVVPDLPGCFSAGDTVEEAFDNAREAIDTHCEMLAEEGKDLPIPKSMSGWQADKEYKGWTWGIVDVPIERYFGPAEKINITVPSLILKRIDEYAVRRGESRSGFLVRAVAPVKIFPCRFPCEGARIS